MIQVTQKGVTTPFDLSPDQAIQVTHVNPALDADRQARIFTLPFTLPRTPRNQRIRKHTNRLDATKKSQTRADIKIGTSLVSEGTLKRISSNTEVEEVQFIGDTIDLWAALEKIKINKILETVVIDTTFIPEAVWKFAFDTPTTGLSYSMQIRLGVSDIGTVTYIATSSDPVQAAIAAESLKDQLNLLVPGMATVASTYLVLQSAIVNIHYILAYNHLTEVSVVTVGERAMAAMAAHIEETYTTPYTTHSFPMMAWHNLYGDLLSSGTVQEYDGRINIMPNGEFLLNEKYLQTPEKVFAWRNTVIPFVRLPYILERIRLELGYAEWTGYTWDFADFQKIILCNNYCLDAIYDDRYSGFLETEVQRLNGFATQINFNNHVPDITAATLLKKICDSLNTTLAVVDNNLVLNPIRPQITAPPLNWRGRMSQRYTRKDKDATGWSMIFDSNNDERPTNAGQLLPLVSGAGEVVTNIIPTTWHHPGLVLVPKQLILGQSKIAQFTQLGQSTAFNPAHKATSMPLVWIFDHGVRETNVGVDYIMATHDNKDYDNNVIGAWSLDILGDVGLYQLHHKGHIELSDSDTAVFDIVMSSGELGILSKFQNARAVVYHPDGEFIAVLKVLSASHTAKGMSIVSVEALIQ
jgi:hypothetical protein